MSRVFSWASNYMSTMLPSLSLECLPRNLSLTSKVKSIIFPSLLIFSILIIGCTIRSWQIDGKTMETVTDFIFLGSKITADGNCNHEIKVFAPWKKTYDEPRQHIKNQRRYFANKGLSSQSYVFSSSHVWMWELDYKESWALKDWCFWIVVLEKTLESPLDCKEIQLVHPEGGQSWVFIGRRDVEDETPVLWPPDAKDWLIWKDPDAWKDWRWEEKGMTEDEKVRWHHQLNGHEFE